MKKLIISITILLFISLGFAESFAQEVSKTESNTSYKIYTYTVVGSNDSAKKAKLPGNLTEAFDEIKSNFSYSNYGLLSTQFQLIKENGEISYKSILKDVVDKNEYPIFAEWSYQGLEEKTINGRDQSGFKSFRLNLRFPVKKVSGKDDTPVVNYESIGITTRNIDFPIGKAVVFASLPIEIANKTLFFVVHLQQIK